MPELAEVEFYRRKWDVGFGAKVERVHLHSMARVFRDAKPRLIKKQLTNAEFHASLRHGKQMLFEFKPDFWLGLHLGMTGELRVEEPDYKPQKHDHLVLFQADRALVFCDPRKFGRVRQHAGAARPDWWTNLPPEIWTSDFSKTKLRAILGRRAKSVIKALLLEQDYFPGIGNWMADEVLWRCRIHPAKRANEIPGSTSDLLWSELRKLNDDALRVIAPDWGEPPDTWLFNHRWKDGGHCPRRSCGAELMREDIRGRTTCWCPSCQT